MVWTYRNTLYSSIKVHNHGSSSKKIDATAHHHFKNITDYNSIQLRVCLRLLRNDEMKRIRLWPQPAIHSLFGVTRHEIYLKTCVLLLPYNYDFAHFLQRYVIHMQNPCKFEVD